MARVAITESYLEDSADAIREKTGLSEETYTPSEMAPAIMTISGSGGIIPAGTININTNGTHNVTNYASANVSVPNSYSSSDEGKVVSSGALVAQSSATYTENGTYDTTLKNSVTVDVEGGGSGTEVVSVVDTTDTAGGTIRTITAVDISDTTATAADVASGKYFYTAAGVKTAGTSSGGSSEPDHWVRPSDMPNLSALGELTEQEVYFVYKTNHYPYSQANFSFTVGNNKTFTVEEGQIINNEFVASNSTTVNNNAYFTQTLTGYQTDYTVFRITSNGVITAISGFGGNGTDNLTDIDKKNQSIVEIYMCTPDTSISNVFGNVFRYTRLIISVTWFQCPTTSLSRTFEQIDSLENVFITFQDQSVSLYNTFESDSNLKYAYLYDMTPSSLEGTFSQCKNLKYGNWEDWTLSNSLSINSCFRDCYLLTTLDLSGWKASITNAAFAFNSCYNLKYIDISNLTLNNANAQSMFNWCINLETQPLLKGTISNATTIFAYCKNIKILDFSEVDISAATFSSNYVTLLEKMIISEVTSLPNQAFRDNPRCLEYHFLQETPPTAGTSVWYSEVEENMKIYVPYSADHSILEAYQTATNWSSFASTIIEEDPE